MAKKVIIINKKAFTLIEIIIVIGLISILGLVVVATIKSEEIFKQSRDSQRLEEINNINKALQMLTTIGSIDGGQINKVYVSLPADMEDCSDLNLPSLSAPWSYSCKNKNDYRKVDGNGWIPVNFSFLSDNALFNSLPVDPINQVDEGLYYTYVKGSWELTAGMESNTYSAGGDKDIVTKDGGQNNLRYQIGNHIDITPLAINGLGNEPIPVSSFVESFDADGVIEEKWPLSENTNPNWWVSSGAFLNKSNGIGKTIQGELSSNDNWRIIYNSANPTDTDNGYHPQNIFRFVQIRKWLDFNQEAYFRITKYNLSSSSERKESNGLLLFNRYQDAFNLYYAGIRVDGAAVIKKKINGVYYTMVYEPIFSGTYNRDTNPNLIPENTWVGLKSEVKNNADETVSIKLFMDQGRTGNWQLVAEAIDDNISFGGPAFTSEGYGGIRTDFMDVEFDDFKITSL